LRELPAVHEVAAALEGLAPHVVAVEAARRAIQKAREAGGATAEQVRNDARQEIERWRTPSLRRVINATGVILHTNLGRAPLAPFELPAGYSNLEYDIAAGRRGKRDVHFAPLTERLIGAPSIAVNNNAAAVYLVLNEFAAGGEAIVSRGELIEIGDGFRIPDIMSASNATLREVGTTNRTSAADYAEAINERTRLIMIVHPSNFQMSGFTGKPSRCELVKLARERGIPLYEDLGSGCVIDLKPYGIDEPVVGEALADGVDLVSFSGDKLLGGPQAGLIAGRADLVSRLRRNPMYRALRLDKLIARALETTLRHILFEEWDRVPALRMIRTTADEIRSRAGALVKRLPGVTAAVIAGQSLIGGGSTPEQPLPTWLIAIDGDAVEIERRLREAQPPIVARIEDGRVLIDLRTVAVDEEDFLVRALNAL
jgi:L-seryl-tRNA(Ser) seleniumtransferase